MRARYDINSNSNNSDQRASLVWWLDFMLHLLKTFVEFTFALPPMLCRFVVLFSINYLNDHIHISTSCCLNFRFQLQIEWMENICVCVCACVAFFLQIFLIFIHIKNKFLGFFAVGFLCQIRILCRIILCQCKCNHFV